MDRNDRRSLGDALLAAQATYQQALDKHGAERSELSRRVVDEARRQLERIEMDAAQVSLGETWH